jgi:hypothetical protein
VTIVGSRSRIIVEFYNLSSMCDMFILILLLALEYLSPDGLIFMNKMELRILGL